MSHSMTWNGTALSTYGLIVRLATPAPTLSRTYESKQTQDRAWAGKGQGAPSVFNLPVVIVGTSSSNLLSRVSTVRGLLDQEDECTLAFDMYTDRYWMAKFDSMTGDYTSPTTWEGYIVFTCHDRKAYANAASSQTETLTENISADYGGTVQAIAYDDDYVYIAGGTTNAVQQLSKIDLSLVATGPDYGGAIYCLCCDSTNGYIYYGGDGGAGQYDMCQLLTSDMTTIVRGPDYGGIIYCCAEYGNYVYYGGNGGAGEYDIAKLLKSDMTTIVRSADYGGIIYAMAVNSTDVFIGGATTQTVNSYLISDLSADDTSDGYGATIRGIAVDATNCYWCGELDEVWWAPLTDLTAETQSADLGGDLYAIAIDDDYIYVAGVDNVVYKLEIDFTAGDSYIAKSADYGGDLNAMAIDTTNQWLYIGGATTQTVWKLDTRHLERLAVSDISYLAYNDFNCICCDDAYVYVASLNDYIVYKLRKTDLAVVTKSQPYYSAVNGIAESGDYIYIGGNAPAATRMIWKLLKETLALVLEAPAASAGNITCVCVSQDGLYVLWGEDNGAGSVAYIASVDDLVVDASSAAYGGAIYDIKEDGSNCFIGGATTQRIYKLHKTTLAFVAQSDVYGTIYCLAWDSTYVYCGGSADTIMQVTKATMATNATSADLGGDRLGIEIDENGTYLYTVGVDKYLQVLLITDLSIVAKTTIDPISTSIYSSRLCSDGGNIYCGEWNSGTAQVYKFYKRVLWQRSDHEITITSAGTASSGLDFASTASQANYWQQQYGNQTSGDEFDWEGTQASGEELEVDSELQYCTLEGASAMSGVTGEFLTLSPGANVLYLENVTGVVVFNWIDRSA